MTTTRTYIGLAVGVFLLHASVLTLVHAPVLVSDLFIFAASFLAAAACYWRSRVSLGAARWKWVLVAFGIFVWSIGQLITTYNEGLLSHVQQAATAINADFYFFLFGIPLLMTLSSANERQKIGAILWIDGLQASFAIYLVHLQIFPGGNSAVAHGAISAIRMTYAYNFENVILACAATLRLVAKPRPEECHLYRVLTIFLWTFTVLAAWLNRLNVVSDLQTGTFYDLLWAAPFLLLTILVCTLPPASAARMPRDTSLGLLVNNASPVFFTFALLIMGVNIEAQHRITGMISIAFALITYGSRSSIVQTHAMRIERKLLESEAALLAANQQLEKLSFLDRLTGVSNRRRFEEVLSVEWNRARRTKLPLSLLVVDLDHFKLLNDRYGHVRGDVCLTSTAQALNDCLLRPGDLLARYGGEEFVAILPVVDINEALIVAERMRSAVEQLAIPNESAPGQLMTVSIGAASITDCRVHVETDLFALADKALYQAKEFGRNRVEVFVPDLLFPAPDLPETVAV